MQPWKRGCACAAVGISPHTHLGRFRCPRRLMPGVNSGHRWPPGAAPGGVPPGWGGPPPAPAVGRVLPHVEAKVWGWRGDSFQKIRLWERFCSFSEVVGVKKTKPKKLQQQQQKTHNPQTNEKQRGDPNLPPFSPVIREQRSHLAEGVGANGFPSGSWFLFYYYY